VERLDAFGAGAGFSIIGDFSAIVEVEDIRKYISMEPEAAFSLRAGGAAGHAR